jgi:hypothetical protein
MKSGQPSHASVEEVHRGFIMNIDYNFPAAEDNQVHHDDVELCVCVCVKCFVKKMMMYKRLVTVSGGFRFQKRLGRLMVLAMAMAMADVGVDGGARPGASIYIRSTAHCICARWY